MHIFDGHNDTLKSLYQHDDWDDFLTGRTRGHLDLPRARAGNLGGGFFAIFTPPPPDSPERGEYWGLEFTDDGYIVAPYSAINPAYARRFTEAVIDSTHRLAAKAGEQLQIIDTSSQLEQCLDAGRLAVVLHLEGAEAVRAGLSNLDDLYRRGVRSIGLVWSRSNAFGHGVPFRFPGSPDIGDGLTAAGFALVEACNNMGIVIDLAHINAKGFADVAAHSHAPLVVSHTDVHAICPSTRNLTDEQIVTVADSGGVIGINFETLNTHPQSDIASDVPITQITAHIDHIARMVGVEHVAFGSDFDGATMPDSLPDAGHLTTLTAALLSSSYTSSDVEKIAHGNWLRVIRDTWRT